MTRKNTDICRLEDDAILKPQDILNLFGFTDTSKIRAWHLGEIRDKQGVLVRKIRPLKHFSDGNLTIHLGEFLKEFLRDNGSAAFYEEETED